MKKTTPKKFAVALYESLAGATKSEIDERLKAFVQLLARNKALKKSDKIIRMFIEYYNSQEKILAVEVISPALLTAAERSTIADNLHKQLQKKIELRELVQPDLLGGIKIKYADTVIDGTLATRLKSMAQKINQ